MDIYTFDKTKGYWAPKFVLARNEEEAFRLIKESDNDDPHYLDQSKKSTYTPEDMTGVDFDQPNLERLCEEIFCGENSYSFLKQEGDLVFIGQDPDKCFMACVSLEKEQEALALAYKDIQILDKTTYGSAYESSEQLPTALVSAFIRLGGKFYCSDKRIQKSMKDRWVKEWEAGNVDV